MELFIKFTWIYALTNSSEISIGVSKLFFKLLDKPWEAIIKLFSRKKKTGQSEYLLTPFTAIVARFVLLYSCPSSRPIQSHTSPGAFGSLCIVFFQWWFWPGFWPPLSSTCSRHNRLFRVTQIHFLTDVLRWIKDDQSIEYWPTLVSIKEYI